MLIQGASALADLCREIKALGRFALDTEFIRESSYRPQLCLLQIAVGDRVVLIDPFEHRDLSPFLELIFDPGVEKVVHAGDQDMEIFYASTRKIPANIFDTQVAAALAGRGESVSYARLVEDLVGVKLKKVETFTDWARRPLTEQQLSYALDDVRYLNDMRERLRRELEARGRLDWLADELKFYEEREHYARDPQTLYRRVKSASKLDPAELAVLRELAAWREEEAERMDRPRGRILLDETLVELARRAPTSPRSISEVRGIHPQLVKRSGEEIVRRVAKARRLRPEEYPLPLERRSSDEELSLIVDLLEVVLRARAAEAQVAPGYLGSRKDLTALARHVLRGEEAPSGEAPQLLRGWRKRLAGDALIELLRGKSLVAVDPARAQVEVQPRG